MLFRNTDSLSKPVDLDFLSPKHVGMVTASLITAGLELLDCLPDEPEFTTQTRTSKVMATIARALQPAPCPLEGVKLEMRGVQDAYRAYRQSGLLAGAGSRAQSLRANTWSPRIIR
jgi:hypothetical protein